MIEAAATSAVTDRNARTVVLDQRSVAGMGADRGLGRYARVVREALRTIHELEVVSLEGTKPDGAFELLRVQKEISNLQIDHSVAYHATSIYHLPLIKNRPWICSIQDVIPLDLQAYRKLGVKSRGLFKLATRADVIVANSQYTAARISARLGISATEIEICPLPVSATFTDISFNLWEKDLHDTVMQVGETPYVVALADMRSPDPRKRFHWITDLAAALRPTSIRVIVTGRGISDTDFPGALIAPALSDSSLATLYSRALATFYPSAYEGQGLPPLEAMSVGCPVIAFRNSSISEVVGIDDFLFDDPEPWEQQQFAAGLPAATADHVVEKLELWNESEELLSALRRQAKQMATNNSLENLGRKLMFAYSRAI